MLDVSDAARGGDFNTPLARRASVGRVRPRRAPGPRAAGAPRPGGPARGGGSRFHRIDLYERRFLNLT
jgi:hypothetical protein